MWAKQEDTRLGEEPQLDRHLPQFWPAPPEPDRVLKETSRIAALWHPYARTLPPPPTPAERAEAARRECLAWEAAERERRFAHERRPWGGRLPGEAPRTVGGNARGLRDFDPALLHALDAAGPATQRAMVRLAARRACEAARLIGTCRRRRRRRRARRGRSPARACTPRPSPSAARTRPCASHSRTRRFPP
ncbi:hypothetical protein ACH4O0_04295 [Streptomyces luteogriseus]